MRVSLHKSIFCGLLCLVAKFSSFPACHAASSFITISNSVTSPTTDSTGTVVKKSFPVVTGGALFLQLPLAAEVELAGTSENNSVQVSAVLKGKDWRHIQLEGKPSGQGLEVSLKNDLFLATPQVSAKLILRVPHMQSLHIILSCGSITVGNIKGNITANTMQGNITLTGVEGSVSLSTGAGNLLLQQCYATGNVSTNQGDINMIDVEGNVGVTTGKGKLKYEISTRFAPKDPNAPIICHWMEGDILIANAPAGAQVSTGKGNITISSAGKQVVAQAIQGNITIASVSGTVQAESQQGNITLTLKGSETVCSLAATDGDITLKVPPVPSMELNVEQLKDAKQASKYRIESDLDLSAAPAGPLMADASASVEQNKTSQIINKRLGTGKTAVWLRSTRGQVSIRNASN